MVYVQNAVESSYYEVENMVILLDVVIIRLADIQRIFEQ